MTNKKTLLWLEHTMMTNLLLSLLSLPLSLSLLLPYQHVHAFQQVVHTSPQRSLHHLLHLYPPPPPPHHHPQSERQQLQRLQLLQLLLLSPSTIGSTRSTRTAARTSNGMISPLFSNRRPQTANPRMSHNHLRSSSVKIIDQYYRKFQKQAYNKLWNTDDKTTKTSTQLGLVRGIRGGGSDSRRNDNDTNRPSTNNMMSMTSSSMSLISSPLSSSWLIPALACATSYAMYNLSIKRASDYNMDPLLGGVILQLVAATLGGLSLGIMRLWIRYRATATAASASAAIVAGTTSSTSSHALSYSSMGIKWSIIAGIAVGLAEMLSFLVSSQGVPATQSLPVIVGGSIIIGTILGVLWLQEQLSIRGWIGVLSIAIGIIFVGMEGTGMGH